MTGEEPLPIDVGGLERWLRAREAVDGPLSVRRLAGGRSNLTYRVTSADGAAWVLRRPPLGGVLASAHDVQREYRIIRRLRGTDVPVPRPVGYAEEPAVTDAPFFVTDFVVGAALRTRDDAVALPLAARRAASERFVDVLAALHTVPVEPRAGREGYVARQVSVWRRQLAQDPRRDLPSMDEVGDRLARWTPPPTSVTHVHGDYRLDNVLLGPQGQLRAVLDWELSTVGDPLADLATALVYWTDPGDDLWPLGDAPTAVDGFFRASEMRRRYEQATGRDTSGLAPYLAFATWRFAAILEGVYRRNLLGVYGGEEDDSWRRFEWVVPRLAERAADMLGTARG